MWRGRAADAFFRTWCDARYENVIEYDYVARNGVVRTWNVYEVKRGSDIVVEQWTQNAGSWVEECASLDRIYHCSEGSVPTPDFESLVYRLTVMTKT